FPSDGLQGAVAQWTGLVSAAEAAAVEGDASHAARWTKRAQALKASILSEYFTPDGTFDVGSGGYPQHLFFRGDLGSASWMLWPAGLLDPSMPEERAMLDSL